MVRNTTFRPFRVGVRRKTSTPGPATKPPSSPAPFSRPTKITRRKYLTQTTRTLESQVPTSPRPKVDPRVRFVSRKPSLRRTTTSRRQEETTEAINDQASESSNQQSLEEDFQGGKTTELGDLAVALQNIQQAPVPSSFTLRTTPRNPFTNHQAISKATFNSPQTTQRVINTVTVSTPQATQQIVKRKPTRSRIRYSTTASPLLSTTSKSIKSKRPQTFEKISPSNLNTYQSLSHYDYYDDTEGSVLGQIPEHSKVLLHSNGVIECLDQGNFPHPISCKKFISCAKMEYGKVSGWEYTCPKGLSFDPIGGMCNWSAGLGCNEQ